MMVMIGMELDFILRWGGGVIAPSRDAEAESRQQSTGYAPPHSVQRPCSMSAYELRAALHLADRHKSHEIDLTCVGNLPVCTNCLVVLAFTTAVR